MLPRILRLVALLIVVAAIIDPAITTARRVRPILSVVGASRDSALIAQVTRGLDKQYTVVRAPLASAAGTVVVGDRLGDAAISSASPAFAISSRRGGPAVSMQRIAAPPRAMLDARVTVDVTLAVYGISGGARDVGVELLHGGVVQSRVHATVSHDSTWQVPLTFIPTAAGAASLTARAFVAGSPDTLRHDLLVDVRVNRWSVLFFDRRPSWISTFVRRALERDPRFAVTNRIITSTNVSRETGRAPEALDAIATAGAFDAVVIGSPEALTARDINGVSTLLRSRGASVLVLPDHAVSGPADQLLGFGGWRTTPRRVAADIVSATRSDSADAIRLRGLNIGTPVRLPGESRVIAVLRDSTRALPVIWQTPVGLGQLYVSGAFDSWRMRDTSQSTFDATWRDIVDEAASAHQAPLDLQVTPRIASPRGRTSIVIRPRDSLNTAPVLLSLRATRAQDDTAAPLRIATRHRAGAHEAILRAPLDTGAYELLAVQGADTARTSLRVSPTITLDGDNDPELLAAWTKSRGGRVVNRDSLASLPAILNTALNPAPTVVEWHPMRSPWWIIPFALALSAEWWLRRRRGLA